jgi:prephenate dehydrogenase
MAASHLAGPVLVIGTGLLGTSVGLGLRAKGVHVYLSDISPTAAGVAQDIGAGVLLDNQQIAPELVVIGAPPDVTAALVGDALLAYPNATVVDIASVKGSILAGVLADSRLGEAERSRYVGTHPMAGREKSGPAAARGELFTSMPWVICAHDGAQASRVKAAESLAIDLGATMHRMSVTEHDESVALISHFPQAASSMIASRLLNAESHQLALAGNGLRDTTRIAASDEKLWIQIFSHNADALVPILTGMKEDLDRLINTLRNPQGAGALLDLSQLMTEGNAGRARIPGKHGAPPAAYAVVRVVVDDRPGELARLLVEIGEEGVNLEELRLDHGLGLPFGLAEVSVLPAAAGPLSEALQARGWQIHS